MKTLATTHAGVPTRSSSSRGFDTKGQPVLSV
jgi:hypothetical protein